MTLTDILALINRLGGASFATLLAVILYGSWKGVWRWGKDVARELAEHQARADTEKAMLNEQLLFWRDIAMRNTGLLETQGEQLLKVAGQVGGINRKLLGDHE